MRRYTTYRVRPVLLWAVRTGDDRTRVGSYICTEVRGPGERSVAGLVCRLSCTYSKGPSEDTRVLGFSAVLVANGPKRHAMR